MNNCMQKAAHDDCSIENGTGNRISDQTTRNPTSKYIMVEGYTQGGKPQCRIK